MPPSQLAAKKLAKKPFGRDGPPRGYPKDQSAYADPENWRYPLHSSWHARAARRYFDDQSNRSKYTEEERAYIDQRINEALKRYEKQGGAGKTRREPKAPIRRNIDELELEELLKIFLGSARLDRAKEMDDSLITISEMTSEVISGKVKDYVVRIDLQNQTIMHDCEDWRKNIEAKNMCKHLGKLFLSLDHERATNTLRAVLREMDKWQFAIPQTLTGSTPDFH